jgi:hypothetical protein
MRNYVIGILLALSVGSLWAQQFDPAEWTGEYSGIMTLNNAGSAPFTLHIDFTFKELKKDSVWTYTMCYNSDRFGEMVKDYRIIKAPDQDPTHFLMDELNGIVMDLTYLNNGFYEFFEIEGMDGTIFSTVLKKQGDEIFFEIFGSSNIPERTSHLDASDESPAMDIKSYRPTFSQSVLLKKKR